MGIKVAAREVAGILFVLNQPSKWCQNFAAPLINHAWSIMCILSNESKKVPWLRYWGLYVEARLSQSPTGLLFLFPVGIPPGVKGPNTKPLELCFRCCFILLSFSTHSCLMCIAIFSFWFNFRWTEEFAFILFKLWFVISVPNILFFDSFKAKAVIDPLRSLAPHPSHLNAGFLLSGWWVWNPSSK